MRAKGPIARAGSRSSSPIPTNSDVLTTTPSSSSSPSERHAMSAEKPQGLSSEEARKLRQAQQRLQKEQWMKKYGQASSAAVAGVSSTSTKSAGEVKLESFNNFFVVSTVEFQTIII